MTVVDATAAAQREPRVLPYPLAVLARAARLGRTRWGILLAGTVFVIAVIGPFIAPHPPSESLLAPYSSPSSEVPLGTDYLGRDVLSRVLWGGRSVLWMAIAATTIGVGFGVALGLVAGYSRNFVDDVIMRSLDVVLAFPNLVLALLFVSMLGPELWLLVALVAITWVPGVARVARGVTMEAVNREFVEAAEVIGVPRRRILTRELLPNLMTPLMVEYGLRLTWSVAALAGLSFLGLGIQPPNADWGLMVNENRSGLVIQPWATVVPILAIGTFTIGTNFIAEGIARAAAGADRRERSG